MFVAALLAVFLIWAGLNLLTDPFNAFGDPILHADSYTQTLNPRNSKVAYLSENFDRYDSYVIGSSSAASYLPETLNEYLNANFYNMFHYGADTDYDKQLVSYLLSHDEVRNIVLVLGLNEANAPATDPHALTDRAHYTVTGESPLSYYLDFLFADPRYAVEKLTSLAHDTELPQAFDVFLPDSGTYDKRVRDTESIGSLDAYLQQNGADFSVQSATTLDYIEKCVQNVAEIRQMCQDAGATLTVILSPVSAQQLQGYSDETLNAYFNALAQTTDYWNFSISPLSYDERYFYDTTHTRNDTADMVLARIFGNDSAYYPDSFGVQIQNGKAVTAAELKAGAAEKTEYTQNVPILLYHHLDEEQEESGTVLSPEKFRHQMDLLCENGYQAVSFEDLIAYVENGTPLPENAVVITFDDGYYSNYQYAYPILKERNLSATIFAIGSSVGHMEYYKDTSFPITPHFGGKELREMVDSGVVDIQSHTYDMHQWAPYETGDTIRENLMPLENETDEAYIDAVTADAEKQARLFADLDLEKSTVLAFPNGKYTAATDVALKACGYQVTLTTDSNRTNTLVCGLSQSLIDLGRLNISGDTTDEELLAYCSQASE